ncbi:hypothetical protein JMJ35_009787 [Cladonia borealis]|uniref:Heme oxygenase-like protein n=1 Tax=Cladonia borealis TaxID=184061 RepID=A0AA39UXQ6_9LECA|nr:hypothetical protein JMJ35_009787 [Cladonia borealis]
MSSPPPSLDPQGHIQAKPLPPLSHTINSTTQPTHHSLNTLILTLLPLSLPPHTPNPTLYARGISHILPIYSTFEAESKSLLHLWEAGKMGDWDEKGEAGKGDGRRRRRREVVMQGLKKLWIPELERAGRLRGDLERLGKSGRSEFDTTGKEAVAGPKLRALTRHIEEVTGRKPHLLLAYMWLLYMALFSGGRYIRARLREAGAEFWMGGESEKGGDIDEVLSFWTFEGQEDEEDLKADLKQRFAEMEKRLTGQEREEVVQEATYIMDSMVGVVEEIAETVGGEDLCHKAAGRSLERHNRAEIGEPSLWWLGLKHVLPMGMFELITGASKSVMMGIEPLYEKV